MEDDNKEVQLPEGGEGNDRHILVQETAKDDSLKHWRELADRKLRGYYLKEGVLLKYFMEDELSDPRGVIVLLKTRRESVMRVVHNSSGHLSAKKVIAIVKRCFTWPSCSSDIVKFCRSCVTCQTHNKSGGGNRAKATQHN